MTDTLSCVESASPYWSNTLVSCRVHLEIMENRASGENIHSFKLIILLAVIDLDGGDCGSLIDR